LETNANSQNLEYQSWAFRINRFWEKALDFQTLIGQFGLKYFPDFEDTWKNVNIWKSKQNKLHLPTFSKFWSKKSLFTLLKTLISLWLDHQFQESSIHVIGNWQSEFNYFILSNLLLAFFSYSFSKRYATFFSGRRKYLLVVGCWSKFPISGFSTDGSWKISNGSWKFSNWLWI